MVRLLPGAPGCEPFCWLTDALGELELFRLAAQPVRISVRHKKTAPAMIVCRLCNAFMNLLPVLKDTIGRIILFSEVGVFLLR